MSAPTANEIYRAAQQFIRDGQPVFPCRPRGTKAKAPLTKNGLHDATLDRDVVKGWLKRHGAVALGIPTGLKYDVLDVDTKRGVDGRIHLPRLKALGLLNGCQRVVKTPSGGWHLYFKAAPGLTNKASATLGLDMRAKGGYVLAAPSYIEVEDGEDSYEGPYVDAGPTLDHTDEPLLWDLIANCIQPMDTEKKQPIAVLDSQRSNSIASLREWVSQRQPGERNNALHWAVCRCIENGIDPHELVEPAILCGLEEHEILLTVNSALKRAGISADELYSEAEALFPDE